MTFNIITLFPQMFDGPFDYSILKRAKEKQLIKINIINLRDFATDKYKTVDDRPYGGGVGMILKVDVLDRALTSIKEKSTSLKTCSILLDPKGNTFNQRLAFSLSKFEQLNLICGHYEGVDERVSQLVDTKISIGDYILTGGEIPALVLVDCVSRLLPGVFRKDALAEESFNQDLLEFPQYTRPEEYKGMSVPKVLLSGNHKIIQDWKKVNRIRKTK